MTDKPPRRRMLRFLLFSIAALALVVALLAGVFAMMHFHANAVRLPAELQKSPLDLLAERDGGVKSLAGVPAPVTTAQPESRPSYESFLRVRNGASFRNRAAGTYVELMHELDGTTDLSHDLVDSYFKTFPYLFRDPITPRQQDWLTSHTALLGRIRHLARAEEPLPAQTVREDMENTAAGRGERFFADYQTLRLAQKILLQQARASEQQGDYAVAAEMLADALRLPLLLRADDHPMPVYCMRKDLSYSENVLRCWLADPAFPGASFKRLATELDRTEELLFPPDTLARELKVQYVLNRSWIVESMNSGTWKESVYGWFLPEGLRGTIDGDPDEEVHGPKIENPDDNLYDYPSGIWEWKIKAPEFLGGPISLPRLDRVVVKALGAMRNRRHSAEALRDFDRIWRAWIVAAEQGGGTTQAGISADELRHNFILREYYPNGAFDVGTTELPLRQAEAALRLARLGVRWRIDPEATQALRRESPLSTPHHPWRDPFTGQPFHTARTTSQTLIYSVGPDRTDQHGAMEYDRQRGLHSPGDIVIRLPQERRK